MNTNDDSPNSISNQDLEDTDLADFTFERDPSTLPDDNDASVPLVSFDFNVPLDSDESDLALASLTQKNWIEDIARKVKELEKQSKGDKILFVALACIKGYKWGISGVRGYGFNSKPIHVAQQRGSKRRIVTGQLSRKRNMVPDDQYTFRIIKNGDEIVKIEREIDRGGWSSLFGVVGSAIALYFGVIIPPNLINEVGQDISNAVDDSSWESVADAIVAHIAIRK